MSVFFTYEKVDMEIEKMEFLSRLYHDRRGGQMIRMKMQEEQVDQFSTCDLQELAATGTDMANVYTTVNTFRGQKRSADKLYNYCSIFVDLDCHASDPDVIRRAKEHTVAILEKAYTAGILAVPTLITDTGRGFGLQYVLKKSIANVSNNYKQRNLFKIVRRRILQKYQEILAADKIAAQPDPTAIDDARVCRIPGTYNRSAGCYCRLIYASEKYYELAELVEGCRLWKWIDDKSYQERNIDRKVKKANICNFNEYRFPFLKARLEQLEKLQDLRGNKCTDSCREQLLFIAYSSMTQLDSESAQEKLQVLNARFTDPLPQAELDHIVEETDAVVGYQNVGYYNLSDRYVIETLDLTKEEISQLGIGAGLKRTAERQLARQKKEEKKKKVIELLKQVDRLTYEEIAEATGVSRRTVCNIAKMEGVSRHKRNTDSENIKSAKNAVKSVCVGSDIFSLNILSTAGVGATGEEGTFDWFSLLSADVAAGLYSAEQILALFQWSSSFPDGFGNMVESYLDKTTSVLLNLEQNKRNVAEQKLLQDISGLFVKENGIEECKMVFQDNLQEFPDLYALCHQKSYKLRKKQRKNLVNVETETPAQRVVRIDGYLEKFRDERFELIEDTKEYIRVIDADVLKLVKTAFMQVKRLKRDTWMIEEQTVSIADLKNCFDSMSYKDIVVVCERMQVQRTLTQAKNPFFYIIQTVWKYKHLNAAQAQLNRMQTKKPANPGFNNFENRKNDYEFLEFNLLRKSMDLSQLTLEQWQEWKKNRDN